MAAGGADEDHVRAFLGDVRAGRHPDRADHYLAPRVTAHQGRPGAVHAVVPRTPEQYADHVREMVRAVGPWAFEVLSVRSAGDLVEATWQQTGVRHEDGQPVVEHGWAAYRVVGGRIVEYWIDPTTAAPDGTTTRDRRARPDEHDQRRGAAPTTRSERRGGTMSTPEQAAPEVLRYAAFTDDPGGGNPAGVVLDATGMTAEQMLAVAADVGFSETAFLLPGDGRVRARYFSPLAEVSFCGHATIAAAVAHAERSGPGALVLETPAGPVRVDTARDPSGAWRATLTSVPPRTADLTDTDRRTVLDALGWAEADLEPALPPRVAYAGAWHPVLAVRTRERLAALDYDVPALAAVMGARGWTTVDLVWRESAATFHARNPFPPGGVVEDPATGAAAAALGGYLREGRHVPVPAHVTVLQGAHMGRPSVLTVDIPADPATGIRVTGNAVELARPL